MSGDRQHFLPRFLQVGFCNQRGQVCVYRKDKVFVTNPINIGAEGHFYGKPGQGSLDASITQEEESHSSLVAALRSSSEGPLSAPTGVPELIASLSVRSKWLRQEFARSSDRLTQSLVPQLRERLPELFFKLFTGAMEKTGTRVDGQQRGMLLAQAIELAHSCCDRLLEGTASIPELAKSAHNRALAGAPSPPLRVQALQNLSWRIRVEAPDTFILPDVGPVFRTAQKPYTSLPERGDQIRLVLLPLAHTHLLIGASGSEAIMPELHEVVTGMAECACEFFLTRQNSPGCETLRSRIGKRSGLISNEEIAEICQQLINSIIKP